MLQTPDFVEEFILDRTLEPALDEFGLAGADAEVGFGLIDPACGSGHFLLGAFARLAKRHLDADPGAGPRAAAARALGNVYGVDLNPFAASIARFRLLVAALRFAEVAKLSQAPVFDIQVAVGDSLLHGPAQRWRERGCLRSSGRWRTPPISMRPRTQRCSTASWVVATKP
ncbi:MAG: DNA methyltransferase [Acidimicrobiales bacterium]